MWEHVQNLGALGLSAVATVVAVWSVRYARRSASAAIESAEASKTLAELAVEEANRYRPPWRIAGSSEKGRYRLVNDLGDEVAYNVSIGGDVAPVDPFNRTIGPRESYEFIDTRTIDGSLQPVVTWNRPP
jgi:hypothetical protein